MKATYFSYRYAQEILEHHHYRGAWDEIMRVLQEAPLFVYPGKSSKNRKLDVVQQVMNAYFDRLFAVELGWEYHPLATRIPSSGLTADFRKRFGDEEHTLTVQAEIQFGNMARWYSDIFKFQTAYSQGLIQMGLSVVPMHRLAVRTDSNVVNFERAVKELPSAELSITLPILLVGLEPEDDTPVIDLRPSQLGKDYKNESRPWQAVHAYLNGVSMAEVGPQSPIGPRPGDIHPSPHDEE